MDCDFCVFLLSFLISAGGIYHYLKILIASNSENI